MWKFTRRAPESACERPGTRFGEGQLGLLLKLAERRFGQLPSTVRKRLEALKPLQLERAGLRLLDARRVEDLLPR